MVQKPQIENGFQIRIQWIEKQKILNFKSRIDPLTAKKLIWLGGGGMLSCADAARIFDIFNEIFIYYQREKKL